MRTTPLESCGNCKPSTCKNRCSAACASEGTSTFIVTGEFACISGENTLIASAKTGTRHSITTSELQTRFRTAPGSVLNEVDVPRTQRGTRPARQRSQRQLQLTTLFEQVCMRG